MADLRNISIRHRVLLIVVAASGVGLFLACLGFTLYEVTSYRQTTEEKMLALASVIGANATAALDFDDKDAAEDILMALEHEPSVLVACLYDRDAALFAAYIGAGAAGQENVLPVLRSPGAYFEEDRLYVFHQVRSGGELSGFVCLASDTGELYARLGRYVAIAGGIALVSVGVSFLVSGRLQRSVSDPIMHLAETAGHVSVHHDYTVRAEKESDDEIGVLVDGFNVMLEQIQEQDASLREARDELESRVKDRTRELEGEVLERRRAEESLRRTASELARSNSELEQFAYAASHDLQEPLRKVQAFGDRLSKKYSDAIGDQGVDYLHRMQNAAGRMQTLISDLLDFSRVTTKAQPFSSVDLGAIVEEVVNDLEVRIEKSGGRVEVGELPTILADPTQMRQLFQNLIGNGLKYCREVRPPVIQVRAEALNGDAAPDGSSAAPWWQVEVWDNGIGFDEKYAERIFGVFQRLHGRSEFEGSGIGLAICRKIVERHGGEISAHSAENEGAVFTVRLPGKQPEAIGEDLLEEDGV